METNEKLLSLVAAIYDASLDNSQWPESLDRIVAFSGGRAGGLVSLRPTGEIGGVPDVARSLDVAESTVKTHLNNIFTKTDTK